MFRFGFFILIVALVLYGIFNTFNPLQTGVTNKISSDYQQMLDEALAKNTPEQKTYDVTFFRGEFTGQTLPEDFDTTGLTQKTYFPESSFNQRPSGNLPSSQDIFGKSGSNTSGNNRGSVGRGGNSFASNGSRTNIFNQECHGIIFDPCIPEVDYGAPRDELIFEKAPVAYYNGPGELPF